MNKLFHVCAALCLMTGAAAAQAPAPITWEQARQRFESNNPALAAGRLNIDESRAQEITAALRPNPTATLTGDQFNPFSGGPAHSCCGSLLTVAQLSYLHERENKRGLRLQSARKGTAIAAGAQADLERNLIFGLRSAFVSTLQAKAVLHLAQDDLAYYDHVLEISRTRFQDGDIAQIDLDRLELQRVQFESDVQSAQIALRTAKIALLTLLNERTPLDQFDVAGSYDAALDLPALDQLRQAALDNRPDLAAAAAAVDKARTDHKLAVANGSTDPTIGVDAGRNPPIDQYVGFNISIPLRIFDRNQGEKLRTELDVTRNQRLRDAVAAQVFGDVDSGYTTLSGTALLLRPYKDKYLQQSARVRDTVYFSYQNGGASLLDFLSAESEYRAVQLAYVNLVGSYLEAAAQLNMAVGREVIQ
ncbi:MAG: TolC family protein [Acidobacteriota bacterium]|nr:TolC family protein [Acidobacteriota bacterium]